LANTIPIGPGGIFEIEGREYQIPEQFTARQVQSYRSLLVPVPDKPRGTVLTAEQRLATELYLYRRAAACVIPGFAVHAPESLTREQLGSIHRWIVRHRPALTGDNGRSHRR